MCFSSNHLFMFVQVFPNLFLPFSILHNFRTIISYICNVYVFSIFSYNFCFCLICVSSINFLHRTSGFSSVLPLSSQIISISPYAYFLMSSTLSFELLEVIFSLYMLNFRIYHLFTFILYLLLYSYFLCF